jgi:pyruvate ferredoxin oxidoreductase gamma subunit
MAFARIGEGEITTRAQIREPDYVMVLDPTLLADPTVNVVDGLKKDGILIANTKKRPEELGFEQKSVTVDATKIAVDILGVPITNTVMLGAFVAVTHEVKLSSVIEAIRERFSGELGEKNVRAVESIYKELIR